MSVRESEAQAPTLADEEAPGWRVLEVFLLAVFTCAGDVAMADVRKKKGPSKVCVEGTQRWQTAGTKIVRSKGTNSVHILEMG